MKTQTGIVDRSALRQLFRLLNASSDASANDPKQTSLGSEPLPV